MRGHAVAPWLVAVAGLGMIVAAVSGRTIGVDGLYDLYAGRYIAAHGIPHLNTVTVAAHGAPWTDQQWLAQLSYYGTWVAGGYPAVAALSAALITAGFVVLGLAMTGLGVPPARMFAWTAATIIVSVINTAVRAQSFAFPLMALTLWLIWSDARDPGPRGRTWLVVPVLVVWANTHGTVLLGAGLTAGYAAWRAAAALGGRDPGRAPGRHPGRDLARDPGRARRATAYLGLAAAAAASVAATPYGTGILGYYRRVGAVTPVLARAIPEWAPSSPLVPLNWPFYALAVATATAVAVAWRRGARPEPTAAVLTLALFALGVTAVRDQVWFGFGGALLAATTLARASRTGPALSAAVIRVTAGILGAAGLAGLVLLASSPRGRFESQIPVPAISAAAALATRDPGARVLGDDECGTALLWLRPALAGRVGYDARLEEYPPAGLRAYARFLSAPDPGWPAILRPYSVVVVSARLHPRLAAALGHLPGWRIAYSRSGGVVAVRAGV